MSSKAREKVQSETFHTKRTTNSSPNVTFPFDNSELLLFGRCLRIISSTSVRSVNLAFLHYLQKSAGTCDDADGSRMPRVITGLF